LKTAFDQDYMLEVFGTDQPNPILIYNNQPLPLTPQNLIDTSYLQEVYKLQPQLTGFQICLCKMGVRTYVRSANFNYSSAQSFDSYEFKCLDSALQARLFIAWQDLSPQHCLTSKPYLLLILQTANIWAQHFSAMDARSSKPTSSRIV
jgi:hypothetical protein